LLPVAELVWATTLGAVEKEMSWALPASVAYTHLTLPTTVRG